MFQCIILSLEEYTSVRHENIYIFLVRCWHGGPVHWKVLVGTLEH
jgi:hypothetical protein